jgi:hypothetical protein
LRRGKADPVASNKSTRGRSASAGKRRAPRKTRSTSHSPRNVPARGRSHPRKAEPFRSAMSMLNFHINRSGRALSAQRRDILERAKGELRRLFGRET